MRDAMRPRSVVAPKTPNAETRLRTCAAYDQIEETDASVRQACLPLNQPAVGWKQTLADPATDRQAINLAAW